MRDPLTQSSLSPNGRDYPDLDKAPATGLYATLTCPEGKELHVSDGDTVTWENPTSGIPEQRRVRFRVVTDTNIGTLECDPVTLIVGLIPFCNMARLENVADKVAEMYANAEIGEPEGERIDA
jgi:hypothetical protein